MKLNLSRVLDASRFFSTKAGKELRDFIQFVTDFAEQTLRALRNGLTFADNLDCEVLAVSVKHNTPQTVGTKKTPIGVIPIRVIASASDQAGLVGFRWWLNEKSVLVVAASIAGTPADSEYVLTIVTLY